jgi:hypothetical protein
MIAIPRYLELSKIVEKAARRGDMATIDTINKDDELRSANVQFTVRNKKVYVGVWKNNEGDNHAEGQMEGQTPRYPEEVQAS